MNVDLHYGKGVVTLQIPDENVSEIIRPWQDREIPDELIETIHLRPTDQPQAVVDNWLAEDPDAKITIVDGANKIALYAKT